MNLPAQERAEHYAAGTLDGGANYGGPSRAELALEGPLGAMPAEPADARCPKGHLLDKRHSRKGTCLCDRQQIAQAA